MRIRVLLGVLLCVSPLFAGVTLAVTPPPAVGRECMVVTAQRDATEVGVAILEAGGNAIDAAVAVGYALAVTHPAAGNLGGGGFMTIHLANGQDTFLNFRETAPQRATRDMFLDARGNVAPGRSTEGYLAVGVPGSPAGLDYALTKYGTLPRARVIAPAIRLAAEGFVLSQGDVDVLALGTETFRKQPNVAAIFLKNGQPFALGDRLVQADLARSLALLAAEGPDAFYLGPIADKIVQASEANGGVLSKEDFIRYTVEELPPVRANYRGFDIVSAPPPSSGGVIACEILNVLSGYPMKDLGFHSAKSVHLMVETMRHAYLDRTTLGDPNFVKNPIARLLSDARAAEIRAVIDPQHATRSDKLKPEATSAHEEGTQTTHYSVVDKFGNAVAVTYTINGYFGAHRIAADTGFFLNNEMDDFTSKPGAGNLYGLVQGESNAIAPGKRPLSSMTPTIVLKDGQPFLVVGSPGGSRIPTATLQIIMNVIDYNMNIQEAVNEPRIHHQWLPDVVYHEPRALSADTLEALQRMGHQLTLQGPWSSTQCIEIPYADIQTGPPTPSGQGNVGNTLHKGVRYGGWDPRSAAGSARGK